MISVNCLFHMSNLQTVLHGYTGYLCKQNASDFAEAMGRFTSPGNYIYWFHVCSLLIASPLLRPCIVTTFFIDFMKMIF